MLVRMFCIYLSSHEDGGCGDHTNGTYKITILPSEQTSFNKSSLSSFPVFPLPSFSPSGKILFFSLENIHQWNTQELNGEALSHPDKSWSRFLKCCVDPILPGAFVCCQNNALYPSLNTTWPPSPVTICSVFAMVHIFSVFSSNFSPQSS